MTLELCHQTILKQSQSHQFSFTIPQMLTVCEKTSKLLHSIFHINRNKKGQLPVSVILGRWMFYFTTCIKYLVYQYKTKEYPAVQHCPSPYKENKEEGGAITCHRVKSTIFFMMHHKKNN